MDFGPCPHMFVEETVFSWKEKENLKQRWLPGCWKKIQSTQEVKENAFWLDKTGQNVRIFEEVLLPSYVQQEQKNKQFT